MAAVPVNYQHDPQLQQFVIPDVRCTGRQLGVGSYGSVEEVEVNEIVCAGKIIHQVLLEQGNMGSQRIARKYAEECQLISSLRHPHIVQFIGLGLPDDSGSAPPMIVMERMMTSLDDLLENTPDIPLSIKLSILADVCRGLVYLHNRSAPIIHRDLSAKNILLNSAMVAKISDLGNSRIVDIQPGQLARTLSRLPGTLVYMPPEAFDRTARYGPKLDIFSFGNLALFTLTQVFPEDLLPSTYPDPENSAQLIARSEVERRGDYIDQLRQQLGERHPMVQMVIQCLHNDPSKRPSAEEVLQQLEEMRSRVEDRHMQLTKLEMVKLLENLQANVQQLQSQVRDVEIIRNRKTSQVEDLTEQTSALTLDNCHLSSLLQTKSNNLDIHQQHIDMLKRELAIQQQLVETQKQEIATQHDTVKAKDDQIEAKEEEIGSKTQQIEANCHEIESLHNQLSAKESQLSAKDGQLSAKESQLSAKESQLLAKHREATALQQQVGTLQQEITVQKESLLTRDSEIAIQREQIQMSEKEAAESAAENTAKDALLQSKERMINSLRRNMQHLREEQSTQVSLFQPGVSLDWQKCASLPVKMRCSQAVLLKNKVYVGGEVMRETNNKICGYDFVEDTWESFPCPTKWSALTTYNSQLVLVGGVDLSTQQATNQLWVLQEDAQTWSQPLPAMPTARCRASAIGHGSHLIVAGGKDHGSWSDVVEVYNGQKWMKTESLPTSCYNMSSTYHDGTYYLVGGQGERRRVFCVSLESLIAKTIRQQSSSPQTSIWKTLPDLPVSCYDMASFGGALVSVRQHGALKYFVAAVWGLPLNAGSLLVYSPLTLSWIHVCDFPPAVVGSSCLITLPTGDIMVIGQSSQSVFKGTLKAATD